MNRVLLEYAWVLYFYLTILSSLSLSLSLSFFLSLSQDGSWIRFSVFSAWGGKKFEFLFLYLSLCDVPSAYYEWQISIWCSALVLEWRKSRKKNACRLIDSFPDAVSRLLFFFWWKESELKQHSLRQRCSWTRSLTRITLCCFFFLTKPRKQLS